MPFKSADLTLYSQLRRSNHQLSILKQELLFQELQDELHYLQAEAKEKVKQCIPKEKKNVSTEKNPLLNRFPHVTSQNSDIWSWVHIFIVHIWIFLNSLIFCHITKYLAAASKKIPLWLEILLADCSKIAELEVSHSCLEIKQKFSSNWTRQVCFLATDRTECSLVLLFFRKGIVFPLSFYKFLNPIHSQFQNSNVPALLKDLWQTEKRNWGRDENST